MPPAQTFRDLTARRYARRKHALFPLALKTFLVLVVCAGSCPSFGGHAAAKKSAADSPSARDGRKRVLTVTGGDTPEGSRLSITADAPLDDYSSYVEGERVFVLISQATLINAKGGARGRGFEDMRVERRGEDVVLSFLLRQGTTVRIGQNFNRLEINFYTNDHISKKQTAKDRS